MGYITYSPSNYSYLHTINHSYWSYLHHLSYPLGASHCNYLRIPQLQFPSFRRDLRSPHWGQGLHHSGLLGKDLFWGRCVQICKKTSGFYMFLPVFTCFYMFLRCKFGKNAWQRISFSEKHVGCEQIQLK